MAMPEGKKIHLYRDLHQDKASFGASSAKLVEEVSLLIRHLKPEVVLDYGCGKGALIEGLAELFPEITFYGYDPAMPGKDVLPTEKADLVLNTDVLEHIPEDEVPGIVENIARISQTVYFNLHHAPANTILPNGENAHCTIKPPMWYYRLFQNYFHTITPLPGRRSFTSVVITSSLPWNFEAEYNKILADAEKKTRYRRYANNLKYWRTLLLSKILWGKARESYRLKAIERTPQKH